MVLDEITDPGHTRVRQHLTITGSVQGVGFRPFVYQAAMGLGLKGWVRNAGSEVVIDIEGTRGALETFRRILETDAPALSRLQAIAVVDRDVLGYTSFEIVASVPSEGPVVVAVDSASCPDCLAEILGPGERRYGYAFTNCTNCGPRFTIVEGVPYDRPNTTMSPFEMCDRCAAEYSNPTDRRFHAQPICCPACGPTLELVSAAGKSLAGDAIDMAASLLLDDQIVAIKGLGGYHLAACANSREAVDKLRSRKFREDKPFAVMVADLNEARGLCQVGQIEAGLLEDIARPIVLMRRQPDAAVATSVAPSTNELGLMLPYTPLHSLLLAAIGEPIVLTSANSSDEPIAFRDDDARRRLGSIADAFLTHNRAIRTRTDDSVVREMAGAPLMLRRSRGYVPRAVSMPVVARRPILACGAELKNTIALVSGDQVVVSHHIGDLKNLETYTSFLDAISHFERLFGITPEVVAHDLHPNYLSTSFASGLDGVHLVGVQHHHAHIAACMVDNGHADSVIGVAFDGLGYGSDGTLWGGEFLVANLVDFERVGWFEPVSLPGGDAVMRDPWRTTAAYLEYLDEADAPDLSIRKRHSEWENVVAVCRSEVAGPPSSSVGRLFDAVSALLGVRDTVNYEGQAAIELEQLVDVSERHGYSAEFEGTSTFRIRGADLVAAALSDLRAGVGVGTISARFHGGMANVVVRACERIRLGGGPSTVALSGGVFLNKVLCEQVIVDLELRGFQVLRHRNFPPNDGCISLGQAAVAAARDALT